MAAAPAPIPGVQRLTEHGYDVVYSHDVPFPPFMKPAVLDEVPAPKPSDRSRTPRLWR